MAFRGPCGGPEAFPYGAEGLLRLWGKGRSVALGFMRASGVLRLYEDLCVTSKATIAPFGIIKIHFLNIWRGIAVVDAMFLTLILHKTFLLICSIQNDEKAHKLQVVCL